MDVLAWPNKDPQETLDYKIDWNPRLAGDTIFNSTWVVPGGLTVNSDTNDTTTTTIWLTGGTLDVSYLLTNTIVTTGARTMEQTVKILIKAK